MTEAGTPTPARRRRQDPLIPAGPVRASAHVCMAAGCLSMQADTVFNSLCERVTARGLTDVAVKRVGCLGLCAAGPLVAVPETGRLFDHVAAGDDAVLDGVVDGLAGGEGGRPIATDPFFSHQVKVVLEHCGQIDPERVEDYVAVGGYQSLTKAVTDHDPGRGAGRGDPERPARSRRRRLSHRVSSGPRSPRPNRPHGKYVVCNGDEGDPGAFMDRSVLESDPQRVLEGMAIAGYAVGANHGYIYVRAEYPLAVKRLKTAIRQAEQLACSAEASSTRSFNFDVEIRIGAGAFVCGEETALIASIEGRRGTPRPRPPYPAASGLWGKPTLINNVETFANVPPIIRNGRRVVRGHRHRQEQGHQGLRAGGQRRQHRADRSAHGHDPARDRLRDRRRAPRTAGSSRPCRPAAPPAAASPKFLDMPVDYESLAKARLDHGLGRHDRHGRRRPAWSTWPSSSWTSAWRSPAASACPAASAPPRCTACWTKITRGLASRRRARRARGAVRHGQAHQPLRAGPGLAQPGRLSTLRYFRDEYMAHIDDHRCPAGVCKMEPSRSRRSQTGEVAP